MATGRKPKAWQRAVIGIASALVILAAGFIWVYIPVDTGILRAQAHTDRDGDTELIGGVTVTHHFIKAGGVTWHYVEAGDPKAEAIVFLHGLPESWYSWHYQLEGLAPDYRVVAVDMKGYGQSEKADADYHAPFVAGQVSELINAIGLSKYNLVTHDWGTVIGDELAYRDHDKLLRYVRMEAAVLFMDLKYAPQLKAFQNQGFATWVMGAPDLFIRLVYRTNTVQKLTETDLKRIAIEFSRDGVAQAVPRYFRDLDLDTAMAGGGLKHRKEVFWSMTFPVLLLQADHDPRQPQFYFDHATDAFPGAKLQWVIDSGHFTELEQPQQVAKAIRGFLSSAASSNR